MCFLPCAVRDSSLLNCVVRYIVFDEKSLFHQETFNNMWLPVLVFTDWQAGFPSVKCLPAWSRELSVLSVTYRLLSSANLPAVIRWFVSCSFLSYVFKTLQTSINCLLEAWQVPNVGNFPPLNMNVMRDICQRKRRSRKKQQLFWIKP